jgi:hypothetical protein
MFFTFPEDARWNAKRSAVEIGEYHGVVGSPGEYSSAFDTTA